MRGKVGLVIGLAAGYVLGTRAGRERYEQIKAQAQKVWNLDPVQQQVEKVRDFAKSSAMALPSTLWDTAVKVGKAASTKGSPGERLDAALKVGQDQADDVGAAAKKTSRAVKEAAEDVAEDVKDAVDEAKKARRSTTDGK